VPPRRGCLACHVKIAPDGRFTLGFEAVERVRARGKQHPPLPLGFATPFADCLGCHAAVKGELWRGKKAPLSMRAIVHPAHMSSPTFVGDLRGHCFSCHEVDGQGTFRLLVEAVRVNDKGVPIAP
jgi:hypothetical protein